MITKIELENYTSHKDTCLEPSRINLCLGPNASGKTNLFRALLSMRFQFPNTGAPVEESFNINTREKIQQVIHRDSKSSGRIMSITIKGDIQGQFFAEIDEEGPFPYEMKFTTKPMQWQHVCSVRREKDDPETDLAWNYRAEGNWDFGNSTQKTILVKISTGEAVATDLSVYSGDPRRNPPHISMDGLPNGELNLVISKTMWEHVNGFIYFSELNHLRGTETYKLKHFNEKEQRGLDWQLQNLKPEDLISKLFYNLRTWRAPLTEMLQSTFGYPDLTFDIIPLEDGRLRPVFSVAGIEFPFSLAASGMIQVLELLGRIFLLPDHATLFLDEPGAHVEIGRQYLFLKALLQACEKKDIQLFLSTHSEHMMYALTQLLRETVIPEEIVKIFYFTPHEGGLVSEVEEVPLTPDFEVSKAPHIAETIARELKNALSSTNPREG